MLKIEKKLIEFIEKNLYLLIVLLMCAVTLYLKRIAVWWISPEVTYHFDMHQNYTQSSAYHVLVRLVQYIPILPLHSIKWITILSDYLVALLCILALGVRTETNKMKSTLFFSLLLITPIAFVRGVCWGQIDSFVFVFIMSAYLLWSKGKKVLALLPAIVGVTLYPCFILFVAGYLCYEAKGFRRQDGILLGILMLCVGLLQGICGLALGEDFGQGVLSCIRWASKDPYTGLDFVEPLLWLKQLVNLLGFGGCMISIMAMYRRKLSYLAAFLIHMLVLLVYASIIFPYNTFK